MKTLNLGFFSSHGGSNMQAIVESCKKGTLNANPSLVISNNPDANALVFAKNEGIPTAILNSKIYPDPDNLDKAILDTLINHNVDLVVLAGYMRMLGKRTLAHYKNRILNIHPALLPKYGGKGMYGMFVHEAVVKGKEKILGVTIHLVDEKYDHGAIIAQSQVPVLEDDTPESLKERVLKEEHKFFSEVLQKVASGEIDLDREMI